MTQTLRPAVADGGAPAPSVTRAFRLGFLQALPFLLVLVPFSVLFGVVATAAGLDIVQTVGF